MVAARIYTCQESFRRACRSGLQCTGSLEPTEQAFDEVTLAVGFGAVKDQRFTPKKSRAKSYVLMEFRTFDEESLRGA
jgi:hypothetical protein